MRNVTQWKMLPSCLFSSPDINLSLTKFPKRSTPPFVFRSHFQEIIYSYTNPTICYMDGSKTKGRADFAFSINNCTQAHRHRNTASSFTTELQAIFSCLEHLLTLPFSSSPTPILIISDSLAALSHQFLNPPFTTRIHDLSTTFASNHTPIMFIWARGHIAYSPMKMSIKQPKTPYSSPMSRLRTYPQIRIFFYL